MPRVLLEISAVSSIIAIVIIYVILEKYFRFIAVIIPNCCFDDKNSSRIEFDTEFFIDFKNYIAFLQSCIIRIIKR